MNYSKQPPTEVFKPFHDGGRYHIETSTMDWFLYDIGLRHERVKRKTY